MKKFKVFVVVLLVLTIVFGSISIFMNKSEKDSERNNDKCTTTERVYDYADVLSDEEEDKLRELIAESEAKIKGDIVIVTINDEEVYSDDLMMNYADDFYDENMFGFNKPQGDGVLYLDNWSNGYCWFSTCGKFINEYNSNKIDSIINATCEHINENPYLGYKTFVEKLVKDSKAPAKKRILFSLIVSLIGTIGFVLYNVVKNGESIETNKDTYLKNDNIRIINETNNFISKSVSKRVIPKSNSSGGSGSHRSSGGVSHGGGGGRH